MWVESSAVKLILNLKLGARYTSWGEKRAENTRYKPQSYSRSYRTVLTGLSRPCFVTFPFNTEIVHLSRAQSNLQLCRWLWNMNLCGRTGSSVSLAGLQCSTQEDEQRAFFCIENVIPLVDFMLQLALLLLCMCSYMKYRMEVISWFIVHQKIYQ